MNYPLSVIRENDLLRRELGSEHGYPRYQWIWCADMNMPMVVIDPETGEPQRDWICGCGVNRSVHDPACNSLSVPRTKWEMQNIVPMFKDQWVLARWAAPEMSRTNWERCFDVPYPEHGYWVPVGDLVQCLALHPGETPKRHTTQIMIDAVREHFSVSARQREKDTQELWEKRDRDKREELRLQFIDRFPVHMGRPGEKNDWSAGGDPTVESPALRKESVQ